jgi:AraC-like DNA-binding protein
MEVPSIVVKRGESPLGSWENIERRPGASLRAHVAAYYGYTEDTPAFSGRRHVPSTNVTVIIGFQSSMRNTSAKMATVDRQSFVAGLQDVHVVGENTGPSSGVQIDLTPLGAYEFFGRPMHELTNNVVGLDDALGRAGSLMAEALYHAPTWEARFELLDRAIVSRIEQSRRASPAIIWAQHQIDRAGGNAPITKLSEKLGLSRKQMVNRFREEVGLPPKTYARIARFGRVMQYVRSRADVRWVDVAHDCGYYDQAHFVRDFSEFAGVSPTRFLDLRLPSGAVLAE